MYTTVGMKRARAVGLEYYIVFQGIKASMQGTKASLNPSLELKPNHTEKLRKYSQRPFL